MDYEQIVPLLHKLNWHLFLSKHRVFAEKDFNANVFPEHEVLERCLPYDFSDTSDGKLIYIDPLLLRLRIDLLEDTVQFGIFSSRNQLPKNLDTNYNYFYNAPEHWNTQKVLELTAQMPVRSFSGSFRRPVSSLVKKRSINMWYEISLLKVEKPFSGFGFVLHPNDWLLACKLHKKEQTVFTKLSKAEVKNILQRKHYHTKVAVMDNIATEMGLLDYLQLDNSVDAIVDKNNLLCAIINSKEVDQYGLEETI